jgi:hypothetical protein
MEAILLRADALRRIGMIRCAKQDALRSFSEGRSTNPWLLQHLHSLGRDQR